MRDKALRDAREEQQELEALHRLDEECVHQQRAGNYLKAFDCMERALVLRRHFFGIESEEVMQACRALAEMCNLLAMSFLQQDNYAVTIDLLKKAEVLTQRHHPAERATTLNNLACYYRRLGKLHSAMTSLKRALELEKRLENVRNAADTQLNMCAVLSQLGKHQEALEHAQEALITLQEGFIHDKHSTDTDTTTGNSEGGSSSARLDRISVMCIAYHNIGVEQEFLKDCAESVASYKKGIGLSEQYLGADHSITTTIRNSYLAAKRTLATKARVGPYSASRDQKSPTKAGARLLLSPRSGPIRMPSPLAKEKDRGSQIPTPRSIVADALSRAPLSALPPLEIQSPPSASKQKNKTESGEAKSTATPLSPTDPFFSPRFSFDTSAAEPKTKKLASITSPRSAAAATVEVRTSPSTKDKRERRKSSMKKPPSTAETGRRTSKASADERIKAAPTSPVTEGAFDASLAASHNENTRPNDGEVSDGITTASRESESTASDVQLPSQNAVATGNTEAEESAARTMKDEPSGSMNPDSSGSITSTSADMTASTDERVFGRNPDPLPSEGNDSPSNSQNASADDPRFDSSMQTIKGRIDPVAEDADGAIFTVLTNVVDKVAEQEEGHHSDAAGTSPDNASAIVSPPVDQQDTSYDPDSQEGRVPEAVNAITELDGGPGSLGKAERGQEGQTELSERHNAHQTTIVEDAINVGFVVDELILDSGSTEEIYEVADVEQPHAESDAVEDNGEGTQECNDQSADEVTPNAESSFGDTEIDIEAANVNSSEHNLDIENAENSVNDALNGANNDTSADVQSSGLQEMMNEESTETNPDEAIETLETVEDLQGTSVENEHPGPYHMDAEAVDRVTVSNTHDNEKNEQTASTELMLEVHVSPLDPPERGQTIAIGDEEARAPEQPHFSNGADGVVPSVEHELLEQHLETDICTYETGEYYDLNYTSAENTTLEDEAQENVHQQVHQQGDNAGHTLSDQELADQTEHLFLTYEQQVQQTEPAEVENTVDYGDYYQDSFALSYEEQRSYDEYAAATGDQLFQEVEGSDAPADVIDVDTEAQDSTAPE